MAKPTDDPGADILAATGGDEWEDVKIGLGDEVPLQEGDSFIGTFIGTTTQPVTDRSMPDGTRDQSVYQFSVDGDSPDRVSFLWGSWELDKAFADIPAGKRVRVTFIGKRDIGTDRQPMKSYRVQVAK